MYPRADLSYGNICRSLFPHIPYPGENHWPSVSMFYDRSMIEKIVAMLDRGQETSVWDFTALKYLGLPWITPETSYLEHYGGGIHNLDYERDRAINPTEYLEKRRSSVLRCLTHGDELPADFWRTNTGG
jgi:hypothetical protein